MAHTEPSPANNIDAPKERTRIPLGAPRQQLSTNDIPGYKTHWFRGTEQRLQAALRSLIEALLLVPSYKETLEALSSFMANASDARPQGDAEKIELVGLERSRNIVMHGGVLARQDVERIGLNVRDWLRQAG